MKSVYELCIGIRNVILAKKEIIRDHQLRFYSQRMHCAGNLCLRPVIIDQIFLRHQSYRSLPQAT